HPCSHVLPATLSFFSLICPTPSSTLFPYTTLFRSGLHPLIPARLLVCPCLKKLRGLFQRFCPVAEAIFYLRAEFTKALVITVRKDRKSTRLNSSHLGISYAVFCLKKKIIFMNHLTL